MNRFSNLCIAMIPLANVSFIVFLTLNAHLPFDKFGEHPNALTAWLSAFAAASIGALVLKAKGFLRLAASLMILFGFVHCLIIGAHLEAQLSVGFLFGTVLLSSFIILKTIEASMKVTLLLAVFVLLFGLYYSSAKEFLQFSALAVSQQNIIENFNFITVALFNFICISVLLSDSKTNVESQLSETSASEKHLFTQKYLRLFDELKTAQETGKVGTWNWNEKTQKIECTLEIARLLGFSADEFVSQHALPRLNQLSIGLQLAISKIDPLERFSVLRKIHRAYCRREYLVVRFKVKSSENIVHRELVGRFERLTPKSLEIFRGTLRDVTAEENAQEAQRERESLRVLNENMHSLGRLAGEVAHEVNNPLAIVVGRLQQIQKMQRANATIDEAFLQRFIHSVENSVSRIHKVSQTLLSFSASLDTVPIGIHKLEQILDSVEMKLDQVLTRKKIKIERQGDVHAKIHCQPTQIKLLISQILNCIVDKVASSAESNSQMNVFSEERITITIAVSQLSDSIVLDFRFPAELSPDLEFLATEHKVAKDSYLSERRFEAYLLHAVLQVHQGSLSFIKGHINGNLLLRLPRYSDLKKFQLIAS